MDSIKGQSPLESKIIAAPKGWLGINFREIWRYYELLFFLTWRDVKIRYKQTVLGVLWAFIQPFIKLVVLSVVFGRFAKMDSEGFPYPIFLYAGLLPWQFFQESLSRSSNSVVGGGSLIKKVYFPRLIIPIASVGGCLVDFAISFSILLGLMIYYDVALTISALLVIPLVLLTVITALGVGIALSALSAAYRDFRFIVSFMVQIWMYVTPVLYPLRVVSERWRWLMALNPMTGIVEAYRSVILGKPIYWDLLGISVVMSVTVFVAGAYYFRRLETRFADIV